MHACTRKTRCICRMMDSQCSRARSSLDALHGELVSYGMGLLGSGLKSFRSATRALLFPRKSRSGPGDYALDDLGLRLGVVVHARPVLGRQLALGPGVEFALLIVLAQPVT